MSSVEDTGYFDNLLGMYLSLENTGMLANKGVFSNDTELTENFRRILFQWLMEVGKEYKMSTKTIFFSYTYFNIISERIPISREVLQLFGIVCLFIANKVVEPINVTLDDLLYMTDYTYNREEFIETEITVFEELNYNLIQANVYNFYEVYKNLIPNIKDEHKEYVVFILFVHELSGVSTHRLPSIITLGTVIMADIIYNNEKDENKVIKEYLKSLNIIYNKKDVSSILTLLKNILSDIKETVLDLNKDFKKYEKISKKVFSYIKNSKFPQKKDVSPRLRTQNHIPSKYKVVDKSELISGKLLGDGSYSQVYKVEYEGKSMALKHMTQNYPEEGIDYSTITELSILNFVKHANIVSPEQIVYDPEDYTYGVIMEKADSDLSKVITTLDDKKVKRFAFQILDGLSYLHSSGIIHRDIKTKNILVTGSDIKIADFGISKMMANNRNNYYSKVGTLWYKAPELTMEIKTYGAEIDIWSAGCVIGEMIFKMPLFPADSDIDLMDRIQRQLGSNAFNKLEYNKFNRYFRANKFKGYGKNISKNSIDFILEFLTPDRDLRPTALQLLESSWLYRS